MTFNRTSMELKRQVRLLITQLKNTFNRTSMELKLFLQSQAQPSGLLLIEPVWN